MNSTFAKQRCAVAHNLLDNSRFEIAQEGYGGLHGTQAYACDRWKLVSGSVSHSDAGMSLNGTISQGISEAPSGPVTPAASAGTITYDASTNTVTLSTMQDTVIKWAALYEGIYTANTLPPCHPKGYMAELLACQRYYYPYKPSSTALSFPGWHYSTSSVRVALPLPVAMDISSSRVPTISLDTANVLILPEKKVPTSIQVTVVSPNMIMLTFGVTGTQHDLCAIRVNAPLVIIAPD